MANGIILILLFFYMSVGVGVVARIKSSRGSFAPTIFAFNTSRQSYVTALMFWVNGSEIRLKSSLGMILLTEN